MRVSTRSGRRGLVDVYLRSKLRGYTSCGFWRSSSLWNDGGLHGKVATSLAIEPPVNYFALAVQAAPCCCTRLSRLPITRLTSTKCRSQSSSVRSLTTMSPGMLRGSHSRVCLFQAGVERIRKLEATALAQSGAGLLHEAVVVAARGSQVPSCRADLQQNTD